MDIYSEFAVHFDIGPRRRRVPVPEQQHPARLREPRVSPNRVAEIMKYLAGLHRHLHQRRVQVVLTHHCARPSSRAAGQVPLFQQQHLPGPHSRQVHRDTRPVDAAPNNDYVG